MTAEIAIMNTRGVALAADSAVTLGIGNDQRKTYNTANKLFMLSKYAPVGIMMYNRADYVGIDWEVIIKEYRRSLGVKGFKTLSEYANNFIEYVSNIPIPQDQQIQMLTGLCHGTFLSLKREFIQNMEKKYNSQSGLTEAQILGVFEDILNSRLVDLQKQTSANSSSVDTDFLNAQQDLIKQVLKEVFENFAVGDKYYENILNILKLSIEVVSFSQYTGIVISGYGIDDLFPSIFVFHILGKLGNSLAFKKQGESSITFAQKAQILPFAQREMVDTFMVGIDPTIEKLIRGQVYNILKQIMNIVGHSNAQKIESLKPLFDSEIDKIKKNLFVSPIMQIVASLQKTDLAMMAEQLVNLTAFKRHITPETETVGGPTDVAVITKGDGFVWIKRKHYFEPALNRHFLNNYYNGGTDEQDLSKP